MLNIEIACALEQEVVLLSLQLPDSATVQDAIDQSGLVDHYPQLYPLSEGLSIYGKTCAGTTPLREGDRVEICPAQGRPETGEA